MAINNGLDALRTNKKRQREPQIFGCLNYNAGKRSCFVFCVFAAASKQVLHSFLPVFMLS